MPLPWSLLRSLDAVWKTLHLPLVRCSSHLSYTVVCALIRFLSVRIASLSMVMNRNPNDLSLSRLLSSRMMELPLVVAHVYTRFMSPVYFIMVCHDSTIPRCACAPIALSSPPSSYVANDRRGWQ